MKTPDQVFIESVEDHLNGTPDARHPVQYEQTKIPTSLDLFTCTLCRALVLDRPGHRSWHDEHNRVHSDIGRRR